MRFRDILCYHKKLPFWPPPKLYFCQIAQLMKNLCFPHGTVRKGNFFHILQVKFLLTHKSYQLCHIFLFRELEAECCRGHANKHPAILCYVRAFPALSCIDPLLLLLLPSSLSPPWAGSQNPLHWSYAGKKIVFIHFSFFLFPFDMYIHIHMSNHTSRLPFNLLYPNINFPQSIFAFHIHWFDIYWKLTM